MWRDRPVAGHARPGKACRLQPEGLELQVLQLGAGLERHNHAIAGQEELVGIMAPEGALSRGDNHRARFNNIEPAAPSIKAYRPNGSITLLKYTGDE